MKNRLFLGATGALALTVAITGCVSTSKAPSREVASVSLREIFKQGEPANALQFQDQTPARLLDEATVKGFASVYGLPLESARLIKDNDEAFDSKMKMIESARKEIRMVYFIYAEDHSSSAMSSLLVRKAASGVKVKLLVDFITNYSKLDHFRMMENQGGGNLKVYFYNLPGKTILEDAKYMTLPCPVKEADEKVTQTKCQDFKKPYVAQLAGKESTAFSKIFLSGLYGKSATALKVSLGLGAQISVDEWKSAKAMSDEDKGHLAEVIMLMRKALGGSLSAKIQLSTAMVTYGDIVNPLLNEATGRLPITNSKGQDGVSKGDVWDHLTDYTHHKLLIVDGYQFQLGGRNVEDSYHMKQRKLAAGEKLKYTFMDTDFWGQAQSPGQLSAIETTYDNLLAGGNLVDGIERITKIMPNEFIENANRVEPNQPSPSEMAAGYCMGEAKQGKTTDLGGCIEGSLKGMPGYRSTEARIEEARLAMEKSASGYETYVRNEKSKKPRENLKNATWVEGIDQLSANDMRTAKISYIENVNYNGSKRILGSMIGAEKEYRKNIHGLWYRGLEASCRSSVGQPQPTRVIIHSAYLLMPSGLTHKIAKMMNGDYGNCSNVRITFLTNSIETTDLNIVNIFARYQLKQLFAHQRALVENAEAFDSQQGKKGAYVRFFPRIEFFEYNASAVGAGMSLHTKISVLGDDVIVGSANADVRSYFMDTNNGVFIRGAKDLVADYVKNVDQLIGDSSKTTDQTRYFATVSDDRIKAENAQILKYVLSKWDKKGRINEARQQQILGEVHAIGSRIADTTTQLLEFRQEFEKLNRGRDQSELEKRMNELANSFDGLFKLL